MRYETKPTVGGWWEVYLDGLVIHLSRSEQEAKDWIRDEVASIREGFKNNQDCDRQWGEA